MEFEPDALLIPVPKPSPQRHSAAPKLLGEVLPGKARFQHEEDASERNPIADRRTPHAARWAIGRKEPLNHRPQFVREDFAGHHPSSDRKP